MGTSYPWGPRTVRGLSPLGGVPSYFLIQPKCLNSPVPIGFDQARASCTVVGPGPQPIDALNTALQFIEFVSYSRLNQAHGNRFSHLLSESATSPADSSAMLSSSQFNGQQSSPDNFPIEISPKKFPFFAGRQARRSRPRSNEGGLRITRRRRRQRFEPCGLTQAM